jgi:soluble lytic murein transglycosylase-like protein
MKTTDLICAAALACAPASVSAKTPFPENRPAVIALIATEAAAQDVPAALAIAVARVESGLNPAARGAGPLGLMQMMPATARSVGYSGHDHGLLDARVNVRYGIRYLKKALESCNGDRRCAASRYKSGMRDVRFKAYERKVELAGGF